MADRDPPSKRRKVQSRSNAATVATVATAARRFSSPDELGNYGPTYSVSVVSRPPSSTGPDTTKSGRRISIRRRTPTRSPSPDELHDTCYSRSQSRSRSRSRSRPRHSRRSRSRSGDRSRSRGGDTDRDRTISVSRSRSRRRRGDSSGSRSRSLSRSRSRSRDRSRSRSRSRQSRSDSRSRSSYSRSRSRTSSRTPSPPPYEPARPDFRVQFTLQGHSRAISQVRISPDGNFIASASADGTVRTWSAHTGEHMDTLAGHLSGVSCIAWSPDSCTIASGSDDKAIRLWDRVTGRPKMSAKGGRRRGPGGKQADGLGPMRPLLGHHNYIHCLAFSPKGNILASGSYDEAVFLWDVRAGRLMRSLPAHSDPVTGIDFSRDGTLVVSCSTDGLT
jgi:COMPASS component SWD3